MASYDIRGLEMGFESLEYPCEFSIKAIGKQEADFSAHVHELVERHCPGQHLSSRVNVSRAGTYICVTVHLTAMDVEHLRAVYAELAASERVLFTL